MVLFCHVVSQDHVIKESCDFQGGAITVSYHPAKFGGRRHCGSGDIMILVCRVIS